MKNKNNTVLHPTHSKIGFEEIKRTNLISEEVKSTKAQATDELENKLKTEFIVIPDECGDSLWDEVLKEKGL